MRKSYVKNTIIDQCNIHSLRNNFSSIKELLSQNPDILIINQTRLNESFPTTKIQIKVSKCLSKDRNIFCVVLCLYINEDFPSK